MRLWVVAALLLALPAIALIPVDGPAVQQPMSVVAVTTRSQHVPADMVGARASRADIKTVDMEVAAACPPGVAPCPLVARSAPGIDGSLYPNLAVTASPILAEAGSWTSARLPLIAFAYGAVIAAALLILLDVMRSIRQFRHAVEEVVLGRLGDNALSNRNLLPEMVGLSRLVDGLITDLRYSTGQMRTASDDHAHALRTPLATIKTALHSVRRYTPPDDQRAQRIVNAIDVSLDRMSLLIDSAQCNSQAVAGVVLAARQRVKLADLVEAAIGKLRDEAASGGIQVLQDLDCAVDVEINVAMFGQMVENVLLGAIECSPRHGDVKVTLAHRDGVAALDVADQSCTCADVSVLLEPTFDTLPPEGASGACWTRLTDVRRTVESMGGRAAASQNSMGGKTVTIELPAP